MKIYLHNPAHNGDVLFGSKIVEFIVKHNPSYEFIISPSCSSILFEHLVSDSVTMQTNPYQWVFDKNIVPDKDDYLYKQHDVLWSLHDNGDLYINMWQMLVKPWNTCMNLIGRIEFVQSVFKEIELRTRIHLEFNVNYYKELIPEIPQLDVSFIYTHIIQPIYKKRIFFFNLMGQSTQETLPSSFNNEYIKRLLNDNPDSIIIVPDTCTLKHIRLISLMDDFNIQKETSGKSLVIYANICNICEEVHFKNNGGSLFSMNVVNIENKQVKYYYLNGHDDFYHIIKNCYELNIVN